MDGDCSEGRVKAGAAGAGLSFRNEVVPFFPFRLSRPEVVGGRMRVTDGG